MPPLNELPQQDRTAAFDPNSVALLGATRRSSRRSMGPLADWRP